MNLNPLIIKKFKMQIIHFMKHKVVIIKSFIIKINQNKDNILKNIIKIHKIILEVRKILIRIIFYKTKNDINKKQDLLLIIILLTAILIILLQQ